MPPSIIGVRLMERYKLYGLITILIHFAALLIGLAAIWPYSPTHAAIYAVIIVVTTLTLIYSFCSKCPCHHKECSHLILGPIAKILPKRKVGRYGPCDYWGLGLSFFVSVTYPEYWLWKYDLLPYIFYGMVITALGGILLKVCPSCKNCNCPFNRHPKNPKYRKNG